MTTAKIMKSVLKSNTIAETNIQLIMYWKWLGVIVIK